MFFQKDFEAAPCQVFYRIFNEHHGIDEEADAGNEFPGIEEVGHGEVLLNKRIGLMCEVAHLRGIYKKGLHGGRFYDFIGLPEAVEIIEKGITGLVLF